MVNKHRSWWNSQGFSLFGVLDSTSLDDSIRRTMEALGVMLQRFNRIVVVGHVGSELWDLLQSHERSSHILASTFDQYSRQKVQEYCTHVLGNASFRLLYPTDFPVPLQQWGALLGWSHPSPMGLGIHQEYGLWFAYRAAFLVDAPLPLSQAGSQQSPCERCQEKPCLSVCPPQALKAVSSPDIQACSSFRLKPSSPCASTCLARYACPVGRDYRYSPGQMSYHAQKSLAMLQRWSLANDGSSNAKE